MTYLHYSDLFPKSRFLVAVNRDRDVAVAVAVAVGSDDRDQFFALTTAIDFVLSPHAYVHNVEQFLHILIVSELLALAPRFKLLGYVHQFTLLRKETRCDHSRGHVNE